MDVGSRVEVMNLVSTPSSKPVHFSWRTSLVFSQLYEPPITDKPGNRFKRDGGRQKTLRSSVDSRAGVEFGLRKEEDGA